MLILQQMIIFVLLMAAGALARRYEILTPANQPQITKLVVNIAYPAIILSGVTGKGPRIEGAELAYAFGVILIMLVLLMISAWLLPRILRYPKEHYGIINVMVIFTNIGFMGVPMIDGIYGKDALIYMTVLLIPFNILFFSYVIQTIKGHSDKKEPFRWQNLANTGMGACILAIVLYLSGIELPYVLAQSITMLGSMTAPLAMMLLGSFLADTEWKGMITAGSSPLRSSRCWSFPSSLPYFSAVSSTIRIYWPSAWQPWRHRRAILFPSWQPFTIKKRIPFPFRASP